MTGEEIGQPQCEADYPLPPATIVCKANESNLFFKFRQILNYGKEEKLWKSFRNTKNKNYYIHKN